ncbi:chemotaxis protein CheW [Vibrio sp. YMD68]|uniref:chemotaxis protein CheW n=1 Tax=Vibrio sp. YMD68 TaxID=3042300 RepID=UPI00249ACCD6|nr:chemotaxis protein CheW [Vibrio sp. YMD68]WGV98617.1 chemotaxis protein CheW [Vibrio sp. YMD68]
MTTELHASSSDLDSGSIGIQTSHYDDNNESADFLSFRLSTELYGVAIENVEEIRVWERPTAIPRSPEFVKGVINLRGMIVPVIDLRARFSLGDCQYIPTTVVLVLRSRNGDVDRLMGLVVDAVSDVVSQGDNVLSPALGESKVTPYLHGVLNVGDEIMSLLDTEELLNIELIFKAE